MTSEFETLRAQMLQHCAAEAWPAAGRALGAMMRAADGDRERALAHRDLGDFCAAQGRWDAAGEAYDEAADCARALRHDQPGDAATDDLLAGVLAGVGDVAEMQGRFAAALAAFDEALVLRRAPGGSPPAGAQAWRALSVALERVADLCEDRGRRMRAGELYRESRDLLARLAADDPERFGAELAATTARLYEIEARLAL